jgi:hypothetical protein
MANDTVELAIEGPEDTDTVTLPSRLLEMLAEGDETPSQVAGDLVAFGCAQRIHASVHHAEGDVDEELVEVEALMMDTFEERFDASFGDLTGHQH